MGWLKDFVFRLLKIEPASEKEIVIREPLTFRANVLKNQIWYRGDPVELEQFFKTVAFHDVAMTRFWASVPHGRVRKIHSGIVSIVVDRYSDIVASDFDGISFGETGSETPILDAWNEIAEECGFEDLIRECIRGTLSSGDGAYKISITPESTAPVLSFYEADSVDLIRQGRKVTAVRFYTPYRDGKKEYRLEEEYGKGYVAYKLYDDAGREVPLDTLADTAGYEYTTFNGDFMMAVPVMFFESSKWKGRGKALFDAKTDVLDALDEVISQWLDAIRMGRVKRYIPEDMIPRDPNTGGLLESNPFDNDYIAVGSSNKEGAREQIDISQPQISYEAYVNSYASFLDLVLQGIMSPSTLGIDLKKKDNAEAQREKEKVTMEMRNAIVNKMNVILPRLVEILMKVSDLITSERAGDYDVTVKFGEYAAPDFGSTIETVVKAKTGGVMSIEQSVEELYGDTWTPEEKAAEVSRLKAEQGLLSLDEPFIGIDGIDSEEGEDGDGESGKANLPDEGAGSEETA